MKFPCNYKTPKPNVRSLRTCNIGACYLYRTHITFYVTVLKTASLKNK